MVSVLPVTFQRAAGEVESEFARTSADTARAAHIQRATGVEDERAGGSGLTGEHELPAHIQDPAAVDVGRANAAKGVKKRGASGKRGGLRAHRAAKSAHIQSAV